MSLIQTSGAFTAQAQALVNQFLQSAGIITQGNVIWVLPISGLDTNTGASPQNALKTLVAAHALASAGQNDVILLCAESNTASATTDYQSSTLTWSKSLVHLIGLNGGPFLGQRSRVALISTYATASMLINITANGCLFQGVEFYAGVASALPTGCMSVTGMRNHFRNCQISGMGASANDIAGAYSLLLSAAQENLFEDCYIGLDTVTLGAAANSQILCASQATRNIFRNCHIATYTNHTTNNVFLRCPTGSLDRWLKFINCQFINPIDSGSTNLTQAAVIASDAGGSVLPIGGEVGFVGATDWNSTDSGNVRGINGTVTAATFGLGVAVLR